MSDAPRDPLGLPDTDRGDRPQPARDDAHVAKARAFAVEAARLMRDRHCEDIVIFDVRGTSQITDFIIIATGTSDRQMKSVGSEVADLARETDFARYGSERDQGTTWLVLDFVEVMLHLFEPATRGHYDLEMMWGDCPRVPWRRPGETAEPEAEPDEDED